MNNAGLKPVLGRTERSRDAITDNFPPRGYLRENASNLTREITFPWPNVKSKVVVQFHILRHPNPPNPSPLITSRAPRGTSSSFFYNKMKFTANLVKYNIFKTKIHLSALVNNL